MNRFVVLSTAALMGLAGTAAAQEYFMVTDSGNDKIMLFDSNDGSLIDPDFILDAGGAPYNFGTPKGIVQVEDEIWVADQISDSVFRFDLSGNYVATITGGLDNIRGISYYDGTIFVSNAGNGNGAIANSVVTFDFSGTPGPIINAQGSPWEWLLYNGEYLLTNSSNESIDRYDLSWNFVGVFHDSDGVVGIDFPQQMTINAAGNIFVAGFSSPAGIYEYDSNGDQINYYEIGSCRAVRELGNGNLMFTNGNGVNVYEVGTGTITNIIDGSPQFIGVLGSADCPADFNGDGAVNTLDFLDFLNAFSAGDPSADFNGDGNVNTLDFLAFLNAFNEGCE